MFKAKNGVIKTKSKYYSRSEWCALTLWLLFNGLLATFFMVLLIRSLFVGTSLTQFITGLYFVLVSSYVMGSYTYSSIRLWTAIPPYSQDLLELMYETDNKTIKTNLRKMRKSSNQRTLEFPPLKKSKYLKYFSEYLFDEALLALLADNVDDISQVEKTVDKLILQQKEHRLSFEWIVKA